MHWSQVRFPCKIHTFFFVAKPGRACANTANEPDRAGPGRAWLKAKAQRAKLTGLTRTSPALSGALPRGAFLRFAS